MIRHIVFFSARAGRGEQILNDLRLLENIPSASCCQVRENLKLDLGSTEIDIVVYAEFESKSELEAFKSHPIYRETVKKVKPHRDLRLVVDYLV